MRAGPGRLVVCKPIAKAALTCVLGLSGLRLGSGWSWAGSQASFLPSTFWPTKPTYEGLQEGQDSGSGLSVGS
jgi:hypothetical protein